MREYAAQRGWTIAVQVKGVGSGASQRELRENLLEAARSSNAQRGRSQGLRLYWCVIVPAKTLPGALTKNSNCYPPIAVTKFCRAERSRFLSSVMFSSSLT